MMKKAICLLSAVVMVTFTACGGQITDSMREPTNTTTADKERASENYAQASTINKSDDLNNAKTESVNDNLSDASYTPPENTKNIPDVEVKEVTFRGEDTQGYKYLVTMRYSPWILLSNTELIDVAWGKVSGGDELPSYESWGITDAMSDYKVIRGNEYKFGQSDYTSTAIMNEAYYCVGSITIENTTDGWSISESNPRSIALPIQIKTDQPQYEYKGLAASMVLYSNGNSIYLGGLRISTTMKRDKCGPVSFILIASENFSPNTPDGAYYSFVKDDMVILYDNINFSAFNALHMVDAPEIRPGVIGKSGEYEAPD